MILAFILLQAVASSVSAEARDSYEPFRQCLLEQARALSTSDQVSEALLERARSNCLAANLSSGSAALFAEMRNGATQDQAVDRVARLREEVEQEALAIVRGRRSDGTKVAENR